MRDISARELKGHNILAVERFWDNTRWMIEFSVLRPSTAYGSPGEEMRLFLTEDGYQAALQKKRQERATKKKKIALAELKEQAEKGNQEAVRELEERRAIARERSRKSAEKRKQRAENDPEYAKYLEERNAEYNRRHTARRKEQMEALRARAEAGDQEAQSQLAERKQYQVRATVKSYSEELQKNA